MLRLLPQLPTCEWIFEGFEELAGCHIRKWTRKNLCLSAHYWLEQDGGRGVYTDGYDQNWIVVAEALSELALVTTTMLGKGEIRSWIGSSSKAEDRLKGVVSSVAHGYMCCTESSKDCVWPPVRGSAQPGAAGARTVEMTGNDRLTLGMNIVEFRSKGQDWTEMKEAGLWSWDLPMGGFN